MCYIARRRDSGRFTFHFTGSAGGVPAANGAPWCGPAAPRQPAARQPGSSVDRQLGSSALGSFAARQLARRFLRHFFVPRRSASLVSATDL